MNCWFFNEETENVLLFWEKTFVPLFKGHFRQCFLLHEKRHFVFTLGESRVKEALSGLRGRPPEGAIPIDPHFRVAVSGICVRPWPHHWLPNKRSYQHHHIIDKRFLLFNCKTFNLDPFNPNIRLQETR